METKPVNLTGFVQVFSLKVNFKKFQEIIKRKSLWFFSEFMTSRRYEMQSRFNGFSMFCTFRDCSVIFF